MIRADLLALTPEAVASLCNMGLVKRAQRELAAGTGPALVCDDDGTVVGTFPDAVVAKLPPGKAFVDCPCTCGATGVCRHRVAVALAYAPWQAAQAAQAAVAASGADADAGDAADVDPDAADATDAPAADAPWSPGEIGDAPLLQALGERRLARARLLMRSPMLVTLESASPPTARLPSCTVRFLVPRDVAYARCDCVEPGACEHLALAVWAFRQATRDGVMVLGGPAGATGRLTDGQLQGLTDTVDTLFRPVLLDGLGHAPPNPAAFATGRARLEAAGSRWLVGLCVELERALEGYHARSALFGVTQLRSLHVEAEARLRTAASGAELPPAYVLGLGEASETQLDHVRLVSLGARVLADGETRHVQIFLADPDTATVLVLGKTWHACADDGPTLAGKTIAPKLTVRQVAHGQVVSKAVTRRANRSIEIAASRAVLTSVTPQRGEWGSLPAPLLTPVCASAADTGPPAFLRPRVLAENVHAIAVGEVLGVRYRAGEQTLEADLLDTAGSHFLARVSHRSVSPHAIDAAREAFSRPVAFVSGELSGGADPVLEVLAIAGESLVVPDVAGPVMAGAAAGEMPIFGPPGADPVSRGRSKTEGLLDELLHAGVRATPAPLVARVAAHAAALDDVGLRRLSARCGALAAALQVRDADAAVRAWRETALFAALLAIGER